MHVIVRFYWQHDLDLIALCMHPDFDMKYWMKKAIISYVRGLPLTIPNPSRQPFSVELNSCYIHVTFDPKTESDVIEALSGIRSGYRNALFKILFRHYMAVPRIDPFYNDDTYRVKTKVHAGRSTQRKKKEQTSPPVTEKTADRSSAASEDISAPIKPETAGSSPVQPDGMKPVIDQRPVVPERSAPVVPSPARSDVTRTAVHTVPAEPGQTVSFESSPVRSDARKPADMAAVYPERSSEVSSAASDSLNPADTGNTARNPVSAEPVIRIRNSSPSAEQPGPGSTDEKQAGSAIPPETAYEQKAPTPVNQAGSDSANQPESAPGKETNPAGSPSSDAQGDDFDLFGALSKLF